MDKQGKHPCAKHRPHPILHLLRYTHLLQRAHFMLQQIFSSLCLCEHLQSLMVQGHLCTYPNNNSRQNLLI